MLLQLQFIPSEVEYNRELVIEAVKLNWTVLYLLDRDRFREGREVILEAFKRDYEVLNFWSDLLEDREFLLEAVKIHPIALEFVDEDLKESFEFLSESVLSAMVSPYIFALKKWEKIQNIWKKQWNKMVMLYGIVKSCTNYEWNRVILDVIFQEI